MYHIEAVEIKPKKYPIQLIEKDWSKRLCFAHAYNDKLLEGNDLIHDLKVRDDDVWLVSMPKCGTTWMQELMWLVLNDYDFDQAKNVNLETRSPFIDFHMCVENTFQETLEKLKSPRLLKSHLSLPLLPVDLWNKKSKTIYVMRDPKDALVSFYHFGTSLGIYKDEKLSNVIEAGLEFELANNYLFNHALEFYALRNEPWVFYTSYEQMKSNLRGVILDVCKFLDKPINEDQMTKMIHHLSFEEMKNNPQVNHVNEMQQARKRNNVPMTDESFGFVRKGKVGSAKEELSAELVNRLDTWIADSLRPHNLTLKDILLQNE